MIYNSVDAKNINTDIFPALENYVDYIRYQTSPRSKDKNPEVDYRKWTKCGNFEI